MDIDTDILISAVECRPILWDESQEMYRDRNGTKNAWEEVCVELKSNFNSLQNSEKNEFVESSIPEENISDNSVKDFNFNIDLVLASSSRDFYFILLT
ncbi:hypothetical protein QTP88_006462 [Uroleucon formosanum]